MNLDSIFLPREVIKNINRVFQILGNNDFFLLNIIRVRWLYLSLENISINKSYITIRYFQIFFENFLNSAMRKKNCFNCWFTRLLDATVLDILGACQHNTEVMIRKKMVIESD